MAEVTTIPVVKRTDIAKAVAELYDMPISLADKIIGTIFEEISENVGAGNSVSIPGFGRFKSVQKEARVCRNPKTGGTVDVPAKTTIKFAASSSLKKQLA